MDSLKKIEAALEKDSFILFVGADIPREITGVPSRRELGVELAREYGLSGTDDFPTIAEFVATNNQRFDLIRFVKEKIDSASNSPQLFQDQIIAFAEKFKINTIVTLAHDNLIEKSFSKHGLRYISIVKEDDVPFIRDDRPTIIQLYGNIYQVDSLILTDQDQSILISTMTDNPVIEKVFTLLRQYPAIFMGCETPDNVLRVLLDKLSVSQYAPPKYFVWPNPTQTQVKIWQTRGVASENTDHLYFLRQLTARFSPKREIYLNEDKEASDFDIERLNQDLKNSLSQMIKKQDLNEKSEILGIFRAQIEKGSYSILQHPPSDIKKEFILSIESILNSIYAIALLGKYPSHFQNTALDGLMRASNLARTIKKNLPFDEGEFYRDVKKLAEPFLLLSEMLGDIKAAKLT